MGLSPSCDYDGEDNTEESELNKNSAEGEGSKKKRPKSAMKQPADKSNHSEEGISFSSFERIKEGDILIVKETFETRGDPKEIIRLGWKLKVYEIDKEDKMIVVADFEKKILKNQQYCTYYDIMARLAPDNPKSRRYVEELMKQEDAANEKETLQKLFRYEVLEEFDVEDYGGGNTKKITKDMIVFGVGTRQEDNAWEITIEGGSEDECWFVTQEKMKFLKQANRS